MKMIFAITLCLNFIVVNIKGQKKIIEVAACNSWERIEEIGGKTCLLSANGNFVMFKTYSEDGGAMTILKNLQVNIERKFVGTSNERALDNDKMFFFQIPGDSLVIFDTQSGNYAYRSGVKGYFTATSETRCMVIYFTEQVGKRGVSIWDVRNGAQMELTDVNVNKYWVNKRGTALLIKGAEGLMHIDLRALKITVVAASKNADMAALSYSGEEIAYISHESDMNELKYFNMRTSVGYVLLNDSSSYLKNKWKLESNSLSFDNDDGNIFFKVSQINNFYKDRTDSIITPDVDIWSYQDLYLQPRQMSSLRQKRGFSTLINAQNRRIFQIETDELSLVINGSTNKYFVLTTPVNEYEFYWNKQKISMFLFSTMTGKRTLIKESYHPGFKPIGVSPNNNFLVWFDGVDGNYYSYNITNGDISNMSKFVDGSLRMLTQRQEEAAIIYNANPHWGNYWINDGKSLVVYSKNDIWLLDPLGLKAPINLTNGYGAANDIRFRFVDADKSLVRFNEKDHLVWAFDDRSKQNGFWKIDIKKPTHPVKLIMSNDAYFFYPVSLIVSANSAEDPAMFRPIKALKRNIFVVRKMSASKAPNLYSTTDFKKFKQLTNVNPNKEYVWISAKLIKWIMPGGQQAEGILHRPDNFDSTKKYPIIFNYYERRSECLNVFRTPELSGHNINIPWYVSRGYMVFEPDFYYKRGKTAQSVISSVESALVELRKLPYIDQSKMGIQGQSHGGYETNVLATCTQYFAAACEMAGFTNLVSEYGSIRPGGYNNQHSADVGQRNLGVFPWDRPDVFIENSPLFHVSTMNTPLLMVHNENDDAVLFPQAIELYLSLRRLGKEVWLLQYDGEGHEINERRNKLDFTMRMQQFFDHYLKGAPTPVWMSKGIPASLKGVVSGFKYETSSIGKRK